MKKEELIRLQPELFFEFSNIITQDRLAHVCLLSGNFGNFEMSLFLSQFLFCGEKINKKPCGLCRVCRLIELDEFSGLKILRPSNSVISTEQVRELVRGFTQSGIEGDKQVCIIVDSERMHPNATNSLLKFIEEPQPDVYIFLLTSNEYEVPKTVKSRAQTFRFAKNYQFLVQILEEKGLETPRARLLAEFSQSLQDCQELSESSFFFELARECEDFVNQFFLKPSSAFLKVSTISSLAGDQRKQDQVFRLLEIFFGRNVNQKEERDCLSALQFSKRMWRSNVSFQNALEYMVLKGEM